MSNGEAICVTFVVLGYFVFLGFIIWLAGRD